MSIIGSDISQNQLEAARANMAKMTSEHNLTLLKPSEDYQFSISPNFEIFHYGSFLKLANCNFIDIPRYLHTNLNKYDVITNPPFSPLNYLENKKIEDNPNFKAIEGDVNNFYEKVAKRAIALEKKYQNFDKFLYENKQNLGEVRIIYPLKLENKKYHYVAESDLSWECNQTFFSGGFKLGVWGWNKTLKSEEKIFIDFTKNFLNRRKDLHGSEDSVLVEKINKEVEGTQFENSKSIEKMVKSWREGKTDWKPLKENEKIKDQESKEKRFSGIEEGTLDILESFETSNLQEQTVNLLKEVSSNQASGDYLASLEWNNKHEKNIILVERRKRRNRYLTKLKEEGEIRKKEEEKKRKERRMKKAKGLEARLENLGVLKEDFERIEKAVLKEGEKKREKVRKIKEERDWKMVNKDYKRW